VRAFDARTGKQVWSFHTVPAQGEPAALRQLDALDRASRILDLGLARVDLRDPEMVVARPRGGAPPVLTSGGV